MTANCVERSISRRRLHGGAAVTVSLLAAVLAGCGGVNRSISAAPPESFESSEVAASQPLALPPNFAALPPSQSETGAQAGASPDQNRWNPLVSTEAAASVAGNSQVSRLPANQTPGEVALLQNAGAQNIDRDVRKKLQLETGLVEQDETMVNALVLDEPIPNEPGARPTSEDAQSYALLSSTARGAVPAPGAAAQPAALTAPAPTGVASSSPPGAAAPAALQAPPGLKLPSLPAAQPPPGLPPPGLPTAAARPPAAQSPSGLAPAGLPTAAAPAVQPPSPAVGANVTPPALEAAQPAAVAAAGPPPAGGPLPRTLPPAAAGKDVTWGSEERPPWLDEAAEPSAPVAAPAAVSASVSPGQSGAAPPGAPAAEPEDDPNRTRSTGDLKNLFD